MNINTLEKQYSPKLLDVYVYIEEGYNKKNIKVKGRVVGYKKMIKEVNKYIKKGYIIHHFKYHSIQLNKDKNYVCVGYSKYKIF